MISIGIKAKHSMTCLDNFMFCLFYVEEMHTHTLLVGHKIMYSLSLSNWGIALGLRIAHRLPHCHRLPNEFLLYCARFSEPLNLASRNYQSYAQTTDCASRSEQRRRLMVIKSWLTPWTKRTSYSNTKSVAINHAPYANDSHRFRHEN